MSITTTFERVSGEPAKLGIWVITQFKEPEGVFVPLPQKSIFTNGSTLLFPKTPPSLRAEAGLLSLMRDTKAPYKIGTDAGTLVWVGKNAACRVDAPRAAGAEYPDRGSSAEIYTNDDPLHYVELEMLGPLHEMRAGSRQQQTNVYTLHRRTEKTAEAEARKILRR